MIKAVVGAKMYGVWLEMLRRLVPYGRTHRLAVLIAGMLQITVEIAQKKAKTNTRARKLSVLFEEKFEDEEGEKPILKITEEMLKDAGVRFKRVNSRGQRYSIAEDAMYQFVNWEEMPWRS